MKILPTVSTSGQVLTAGFYINFIISACINFGANLGVEWAVLTKFGKSDMQPVRFAKKNESGNELLVDFVLTTVLVSFFLTVIGSGGYAVRETRFFAFRPHCVPIAGSQDDPPL